MDKTRSNDNQQLRELKTRVEELSRALQEMKRRLMLSEKSALLGQLVAGIAHEINTPLGALKSNADLFMRYTSKIKAMLFDPESPAEIRENPELLKLFAEVEKLNRVNKEANDRIVEIVNSIRRYARQDECAPTQADLHDILNSTLAIVHHELKNRVAVHLAYQADPLIHCFPGQLSQIFVNLIVNASHAIEGQGEIFIKTYNRNSEAVVEIRDTGKGISQSELPRIFEAGFTTKKNGMGMGLALVKQMADNHRGRIEVESTVGAGTTFRIILPAGELGKMQ